MKPFVKSITVEYETDYVQFTNILDEDGNVNIDFGAPEIQFSFAMTDLEELEDFIQRLTELKKLFKPE